MCTVSIARHKPIQEAGSCRVRLWRPLHRGDRPRPRLRHPVSPGKKPGQRPADLPQFRRRRRDGLATLLCKRRGLSLVYCPMPSTASLKLPDKNYSLPIMTGTEGEKPSTSASCGPRPGLPVPTTRRVTATRAPAKARSPISMARGILRHRDYPIDQLAQHQRFRRDGLSHHLRRPAERRTSARMFRAASAPECGHRGPRCSASSRSFPRDAPPMSMLSSIVASLASHYPHLADEIISRRTGHLRPRGGHGHLEDPDHRRDDLPVSARPPTSFRSTSCPSATISCT